MQQFNNLTIGQYNNKKGVTLLELIIAVCIFTLIVIGFSSIDTFSRYHVVSSDRRVKLQNDASYVLEHMAKHITGIDTQGGAIGDVTNTPTSSPVSLTFIGGENAIVINIDYNNNGKWDGTSTDRQIAYRYSAANYEIWYYSPYSGGTPGSPEVITSKKIRPNFSSTTSQPTYCSYSTSAPYNDYIEVQIGACWDPAGTCGTPDNPALSMKNRIYMPAVSIH